MKTSLKRRDYREYLWKPGERLLVVLRAVFVVLLLSYFFYRSLLAALPLALVGVLYYRMQKRKKIKRCREELAEQFKECILSVSASLRAGYAVENAFLESREDMRMLYGEQSIIYQELELIRRGLIINITLEDLLNDLAGRCDDQGIKQFTRIFIIAKRSGGNLTEVFQTTTGMIEQRINTGLEIRTMLSGRQMEQNVMKCMPFGILLYVGISNPGYFDSLYHNWQGMLIMTGCLCLYLAAYFAGDHILKKIEEELAV